MPDAGIDRREGCPDYEELVNLGLTFNCYRVQVAETMIDGDEVFAWVKVQTDAELDGTPIFDPSLYKVRWRVVEDVYVQSPPEHPCARWVADDCAMGPEPNCKCNCPDLPYDKIPEEADGNLLKPEVDAIGHLFISTEVQNMGDPGMPMPYGDQENKWPRGLGR